MTYRYLDDTAIADVAFEARGNDLEDLFRSAWEATLATMIDNPECIARKTTHRVNVHQNRTDLLLHDFLQELLFYKDAEGILLQVDQLNIKAEESQYRLDAVLAGEKIDHARHEMRVDVKAVTFYQLYVDHSETGWRATVVLDV